MLFIVDSNIYIYIEYIYHIYIYYIEKDLTWVIMLIFVIDIVIRDIVITMVNIMSTNPQQIATAAM